MLLKHEWLNEAMNLPIGSKKRIIHGSEKTPAMLIENNSDNWRAYCYRCGCGSYVTKTFVRTGFVKETDTIAMNNLKAVNYTDTTPGALTWRIERFLSTKNMSMNFLMPWIHSGGILKFDDLRHRVVFQDIGGTIIGRSILSTKENLPKWITYQKGEPICYGNMSEYVIVVEDFFSYCKVMQAVKLGFGLCPSLHHKIGLICAECCTPNKKILVKLAQTSGVIIFFDGDVGGIKGTEKLSKRLKSLGVPSVSALVPDKDPKDLQVQELGTVLNKAIRLVQENH